MDTSPMRVTPLSSSESESEEDSTTSSSSSSPVEERSSSDPEYIQRTTKKSQQNATTGRRESSSSFEGVGANTTDQDDASLSQQGTKRGSTGAPSTGAVPATTAAVAAVATAGALHGASAPSAPSAQNRAEASSTTQSTSPPGTSSSNADAQTTDAHSQALQTTSAGQQQKASMLPPPRHNKWNPFAKKEHTAQELDAKIQQHRKKADDHQAWAESAAGRRRANTATMHDPHAPVLKRVSASFKRIGDWASEKRHRREHNAEVRRVSKSIEERTSIQPQVGRGNAGH